MCYHFVLLTGVHNRPTSVDKLLNYLIIISLNLWIVTALCVLQVRSSYRAGELFVKTMVREKAKNAGDSLL